MSLADYIPHFVAMWQWTKGRRLVLSAALMTAGEAWVTNGGWLPFADDSSPRLRLALIAGVVGLAFYYRWRASRAG